MLTKQWIKAVFTGLVKGGVNVGGNRIFHKASGRGKLVPQKEFILLVWIPCRLAKFSACTSLMFWFLSIPSITFIFVKAPWKGGGRNGLGGLVGNNCLESMGLDGLGRMSWAGLVGNKWLGAIFWEGWIGKNWTEKEWKCDESNIKWNWKHDENALKSMQYAVGKLGFHNPQHLLRHYVGPLFGLKTTRMLFWHFTGSFHITAAVTVGYL